MATARSVKAARTRKKNQLNICIESARNLLETPDIPAHRLSDVQGRVTTMWSDYEAAQGSVEELLDDDANIDVGQALFDDLAKQVMLLDMDLNAAIADKNDIVAADKQKAQEEAQERKRAEDATAAETLKQTKALEDATAADETRNKQFTADFAELEALYKEVADRMAAIKNYTDALVDKESPTSSEVQRHENDCVQTLLYLEKADDFVKSLSLLKPHEVKNLNDARLRERAAYFVAHKGIVCQLDTVRAKNPDWIKASPFVVPPPSTSKRPAMTFKKSEFPKFGGSLRELPSFRDDWKGMVAPELSERLQLYHLKDCVPEKDKVFVDTCGTMDEFWLYMEAEYGKKEDLVTDRLEKLSKYSHPKTAKNDTQKFREMHQVFKEVHADMTKMGSVHLMDHPHSIKEFMKNLPHTSQGEYVKYKMQHTSTAIKELDKVKAFLEEERQRLKIVEEIFGGSKEKVTPEYVCHICDKPGHKVRDCPTKKVGGGAGGKYAIKAHGGQGGTTPASTQSNKPPCIVCKKKHVFTAGGGKELTSTRLSSCQVFLTGKTAEERVKYLQEASGCVRCLDYTGQHQVENCKASEKTITKCMECDLKHSAWVHFSKNPYASHRGQSRAEPMSGGGKGGPRLDSAVEKVEEDQLSQAPTQEQINQQDVESANAMFLLEKIKVLKQNSTKEGIEGIVFHDNGSNATMIREGFAESLGLEGTEVLHSLVRTGGDIVEFHTKAYNVRIRDKSGQMIRILALGVDTISSPVLAVNLEPVAELFPGVPGVAKISRPHGEIDLMIGMNHGEILPKEIYRVRGLGLWESQISRGRLLLSGTHPLLKLQSIEKLSDVADRVKHSANYATYVLHHGKSESVISHRVHNSMQFLEAEELGVHQPRRCERCRTCCRCSEESQTLSRTESMELAQIEENVKIVFIQPGDECGKVYFRYPTKGDVNLLRDNRYQAVGFQQGVAKKQDKDGTRAVYNGEIAGYIDRQTFHKLSKEEMEEWTGAVNYITHHGVLKPSSLSTSLRVVSNSSLRNNQSRGLSLNDFLIKGPNSLHPIIQVQIDWRTLGYVVIWDYVKCYNTVYTYNEEMHLRRLVHRDCDEDDWTTYGIRKMHFGDKCAACGLEVAKDKIADLGRDIDEDTVIQLKRGYVDDGLGGGSEAMVDKLVGKEIYDKDTGKWSYDGTVARIMRRGEFKIKFMLRNGEDRPELLEMFGGSVLGLPWNPQEDKIEMKLKVNLHPRVRGVRSGPDLTVETLYELYESELTRKVMLSQVNGNYDPLGLLCPITIKYKLLLQKIVEQGLQWGEVLSGDLLVEAQDILKEMVLAETVRFPRCVVGEGWQEGGMLVGFWDGGNPASACCLYARSPLSEPGVNGETHKVHLLAGKARVTPTSKKHGRLRASTPRTEMRGLLMLSRLIESVLPGFQIPPTEIYLAGDSQSTISCVEADHKVLDVWYTNRVAEVVDNVVKWEGKGFKVHPLQHWPGPENVADLATKGKAKLEDVMEGSLWQNGPNHLRFPISQWPGSREFTRKLPEDIPLQAELRSHAASFMGLKTVEKKKDVSDRSFNVKEVLKQPFANAFARFMRVIRLLMIRTNRIKKVVGVVARLMTAQQLNPDVNDDSKILDALRVEPNAKMIKLAEQFLFVVNSLEADSQVKNYRRLNPIKQKGVWGCQGRLGESGLMKLVGATFLPLLPLKSDLARLLMNDAHEANHEKVDGTLARSRSRGWTIRGRYLSREVVNQCFFCRTGRYKMMNQRMGDLPAERISINCKPFFAICLDLFCPYSVIPMVKQRSSMKVWPILFVCQASGAVHAELMHNYGTQAFLLQWNRFTAIRGDPQIVVSDRGSQLTSKANLVAFSKTEAPDGWDWEEIKSVGARKGTDWRWVPAGSQFRNGLAERRVAALKSTLDHLMANSLITGKPTLNYAELATLLARVCSIVNDRPVGLKHHNEDILVPLTINQLLLGKTATARPLVEEENLRVKEDYHAADSYLHELTTTWWNMWRCQALPTLLPYYRGEDSTRHRNLRPGDVCLLLYESKVVANYRLCRVASVKESKDGCVRTVFVTYLPNNQLKLKDYDKSQYEEKEVAIQRLALIVTDEELRGEPIIEEDVKSANKVTTLPAIGNELPK